KLDLLAHPVAGAWNIRCHGTSPSKESDNTVWTALRSTFGRMFADRYFPSGRNEGRGNVGGTQMTGQSFSRRGLMEAAAASGTAALIPQGLSAQPVARSANVPGAPLPARGELLIRGASVLTMDPAVPDLAAGDVHLRDGAIIAVAARIEAPAAELID